MAGIGLDEFLENILALLDGNADPGIAHFDAQKAAALVVRQLDFDADAAFLGEFDGVADQIGQHLAEAHFVNADDARHIMADHGDDLDALGMGAGPQKLGDAIEQGADFDFVFIQGERTGFDLGEIQNVADQGEQRFARLGDGLGIGALVGAQIGFQQQPAHAQHAIHGGADFVAHGGQEARLGPGARLGGIARFGQRVFERLALGDVAADALHFDQAAIGSRMA